MAEEFTDLDVPVDSTELADMQFARMEDHFPGWVPSAAQLDTWIIEGGSFMGSEVGALALMVSPELWKVFGERVVKLLPVNAKAASGTTTFAFSDSLGHTVDAGTVLDIQGIGFEVAETVNVPNGEDTAVIGIVAVEEGAEGTGLTGVGGIEIVDTVNYSAVVTLVEPTSGGTDGEDIDTYMNRLALEQELNAPRPLNVTDVEKFVRRTPGIERAAVLDNYKPGPPYDPDPADDETPLTFTIVPIDDEGEPVGPAPATALMLSLQAARGTNWRIFLIVPQYTTFDVEWEATCYADAVPAEVEAQGNAVVAEFFNPANWGQPQHGEQRRWVNKTFARHRELAAALDRVEGLDEVTVLRFGRQGTALTENVDVALLTATSPTPLPRAGDITGEVTAP